jgi:hypothetical protein
MEPLTYRLFKGHRLSTKKLMKMAKSGGWVLYQPIDSTAETEAEQTHLMADTYMGEVVFIKSGKDNWSEIQLDDPEAITPVWEAMLKAGGGLLPWVGFDQEIH